MEQILLKPTPLRVYEIYLAMRLHFQGGSYDFIKYKGKVRVNHSTLKKKNDRYFFAKLSRRFATEEEVIEYFFSNYAYAKVDLKWIGAFGDEPYRQWLRVKESFEYQFQNDAGRIALWMERNGKCFDDLFVIQNGQYPPLLTIGLNMETLIILDTLLGCFLRFDRMISDTILWPAQHLKLDKYGAFLSGMWDRNEFRKILLSKIQEAQT